MKNFFLFILVSASCIGMQEADFQKTMRLMMFFAMHTTRFIHKYRSKTLLVRVVNIA